MKLLKLYGVGVAATFIFFGLSALPGRGRPWANAHPEIRGGGDLGFGGLDFYE